MREYAFCGDTGAAVFRRAGSALAHGHLLFVVVLTGGRGGLSSGAQFDVVAAGQQSGQCHLCWHGADFVGNSGYLVGYAEIALDVLAGEPRIIIAEVGVVVELFG